MKRLLCISLAIAIAVSASAEELSERQQKLKEDIIEILKIDGTVTVTEDGLICLNDGIKDYPYYLYIKPNDLGTDGFVFARLFIMGEYSGAWTKQIYAIACQMGAKKAQTIKTYCKDSGYMVAAEFYIPDAKYLSLTLPVYTHELSRVFDKILPQDCSTVLEKKRNSR